MINPNKLNAVGRPVGYRLHATHCVTPFLNEAGPSGPRSNFIRNHVWVTPFNEDERYPAGEYVCNSDGSSGLAEVVKQGPRGREHRHRRLALLRPPPRGASRGFPGAAGDVRRLRA